MIDRIRQVGHLCRPLGVANIYYANVNNESVFMKASIQVSIVRQ